MAKLKKSAKKSPPSKRSRRFAVPTSLAAEAAIGSTAVASLLTPREKETAARVLSGEAPPDIDSMEQRPLMRDAVIEALGSLGIDKVYLGKALKMGLEAKETKFFAHEGTITDRADVIAWGPRKAYLDKVMEIMGVSGQGAAGGQTAGVINNNVVYKSHLGEVPMTMPITAPKDTVIHRRMQSQRPTNRKGV